MSRTNRRRAVKNSRKLKPTSFMAMCVTCGLFLGFGLGVLVNNVLPVMLLGVAAGTATGYIIDKRNGIAYTRPTRSKS